MAQSKPRVVIPRKAEELIELAKTIQSKDQELAEKSPIALLKWQEKATAVQAALDAHRQAEECRRQMEMAYEQRDKLLTDITTWVRQTRDVLTGFYRKEMQTLGDFGFTVNSSPRSSNKDDNDVGG